MRITVVNGHNNKKYLYFHEPVRTKEGQQILLEAKQIVTRNEYKHYLKGMNKIVTESFMLENNLIPAQFIQDIQERLLDTRYPHIKIERLDRLYDTQFNDDVFQEWLDNINLPPKISVETPEYIYQKWCVRNLLIAKIGRIKVGTGGGKTLITYLYIKYLLDNVLRLVPKDEPRKILLVIDRKDLIIQTKREYEAFDSYNQFNDNDYSVPLIISSIYSGAKKVNDANVVIATWQSIKEYEPDWFHDFKVFMVDEAHKGQAYNIRRVIYENCVNIDYCSGYTATWQDYNTLEYLSVISMFGPLVYQKSTRKLIDDGNIADVLIVRININYNEYERDFRKRLNENYPDLRGTEKYLIEKAYFHNHVNRTMVCINLIKSLPNNHLILVDTVAYITILADMIQQHVPDRDILIIYSDINTEKREANKANMQNMNKQVMIATKETMSTGVSINNIWYVHNMDGGKSPIVTSQGLGRAVRKYDGEHGKKEKAVYFDYVDNVYYASFKKHANERLKIFQKEQLNITEISVNVEPVEYEFT